MNIRSLSFLILIFLSFVGLQGKNPHATIIAWTPGSYGNYPGISEGRPLLPVWVRIDFDQSVSEDFVDKFFKFLMASVDPSAKVKNYKVSRHGLGGFVITVKPSVKKEKLQDLIDKANNHFDLEYKSIKEFAEIKVQEKIQKEILEKQALEVALKKQFEIERLKKEAEKRAQEERKAIADKERSKLQVQLQEEQKRKNEENLRREKENQIKLAETKKFKDTMSNSKQVFSIVEQMEYNRIMWKIAGIKEYFSSMGTGGALRSSAYFGVVKGLLQNIGTSISYEIYQEMVSSGELK